MTSADVVVALLVRVLWRPRDTRLENLQFAGGAWGNSVRRGAGNYLVKVEFYAGSILMVVLRKEEGRNDN